MSVFAVHDWVEFTQVIQPPERVKIRGAFGENLDYDRGESTVVDRAGTGQVKSVARTLKTVGGAKYRTARVDCGKYHGGTLTVILDSAVLVGKQIAMFEEAPATAAPSIYETQGRIS